MKYYGKISDNKDLVTKEFVSTGFAPNPTVVTGTLTAGETSLVLSNAAISSSSIIDVYTDVYGVSPYNVVASTGSVTLTFKVQSNDLGVRVEVR